jgi:hypothetical protein
MWDSAGKWVSVYDSQLGVYELRERTAMLLEQVAASGGEHAQAAVELLADLRLTWTREKRWRNTGVERPPAVIHIAGPVINCRQPRPSCPGYIVDRRQTCELCGAELAHGRWVYFYEQGQAVAVCGSVTLPADGKHRASRHWSEVPCGGDRRS